MTAKVMLPLLSLYIWVYVRAKQPTQRDPQILACLLEISFINYWRRVGGCAYFYFFFLFVLIFQMIWLWKRKRKPVRQPQPNQEISLINKEKFIGWRELQTRKYSDPIASQTIKQNKWTYTWALLAYCPSLQQALLDSTFHHVWSMQWRANSIYICRNITVPVYIRNPIFHFRKQLMISFPPTPDLPRRRVTFTENSVPQV